MVAFECYCAHILGIVGSTFKCDKGRRLLPHEVPRVAV
jgi:hypothetical protein